MTYLADFADFAAKADPGPEVRAKTALILADTIGAIVGGAAEPEVENLRSRLVADAAGRNREIVLTENGQKSVEENPRYPVFLALEPTAQKPATVADCKKTVTIIGDFQTGESGKGGGVPFKGAEMNQPVFGLGRTGAESQESQCEDLLAQGYAFRSGGSGRICPERPCGPGIVQTERACPPWHPV